MEDEEYELVSHEEVARLKREIERLKSNPFIQNSSDERFYEAVNNLTESVNKLYTLFDNVNKQLLKEYQTGNSPEEKIDKILEQNTSIAEALVSLSSRMEGGQEQAPQQYAAPQQFQQDIFSMPEMNMPPQLNLSNQPLAPQMNQSQQPQQTPPAQVSLSQINAQLPQAQQSMQSKAAPFQRNFQSTVPTQNQQVSQGQAQFNFNQPQMPPFQGQSASQASANPQQTAQRSVFTGDLELNYPAPNRFQPLNEAPSIGAPLDIQPQPKKKGLLGLLKK